MSGTDPALIRLAIFIHALAPHHRTMSTVWDSGKTSSHFSDYVIDRPWIIRAIRYRSLFRRCNDWTFDSLHFLERWAILILAKFAQAASM
jgi:hypothetical protein